jgi:hypothetical protein
VPTLYTMVENAKERVRRRRSARRAGAPRARQPEAEQVAVPS